MRLPGGTLPGREMSVYKSPESGGACLARSQKGRRVSVAGMKWARGQVDQMVSVGRVGTRCVGIWQPTLGALAFTLREMGTTEDFEQRGG